ncbi:MAG: glycoside hydrolase family 43 protein [Colwellia sp.]
MFLSKKFLPFSLILTFALLLILPNLLSCSDNSVSPEQLNSSNAHSDHSLTNNPLIEQRADPWIYKDTDDSYYFIASVPEYDRLELRTAKSINVLKTAEVKTIWQKHTTGKMGAHIWAPELHKIDGKWYIYFAAGESEDIWAIRMWVLSNDSVNPLEGEWQEEGQLDSGWQSFALDATTFEHKGKRYLIWAQGAEDKSFKGTALWMSEMANPTKLKGEVVLLTKPELAWETIGHHVNEGPAVLIRNNKVFVTYSASATDDNYTMGLLWVDVNADLMDVSNWHKSPQPVFATNESLKRFGPGHNSFTVADDGITDLLVYHARNYKELQGNPLTDPNRHTYIREILWDKAGFPIFGQDK